MTTKNKKRVAEKSIPSLGRKALVGTMGTLMGFTMCVPFGTTQALAEEVNGQSTEPDSNAQTSESQSAKTEAVYARTDATGKKSGIYVVNDFDTPTAQTVTDPGTYTKVQNLSTSEELTNVDGEVTLTTTANEPLYYQGDLDASTQLPWDIQVTYRLDGKVVSPDELSGKSGKLDIELKVTGVDDDSATSDFAKSFMVQAQGTFHNDNFHLDDSDDGTVAVVGDNTLVTYLLIPGTNGNWHITGDATNFTYSGWQISAMPLSMDLNMRDADTSKLTDATSKLTDGVDQLASGGHDLASALDLINAGAGSAQDGSGELASGADQLATGTGEAVSGATQLSSGAAQLSGGLDSLDAGAQSAKAGSARLAGGAAQLKAALEEKDGSLDALKSGASQVADGTQQLYDTLSTTLPQQLAGMNSQLNTAKQSVDGIQQELAAIQSSTQSMGEQGKTAFSQAETVKADLEALSQATSGMGTALGSAGTSAGTAAAKATAAQGQASQAAADATTAYNTLAQLDKDTTLTADQKQAVENAMASAKSAADNSSAAAGTAGSAASDASTAASTIQTLATGMEGMSSTAQQLQSDARALSSTLSSLEGNAAEGTGIQGVLAQSKTVLEQSNKLAQSSKDMVSDAQQQLAGVDLTGLKTLNDGAHQVSAGVDTLAGSLQTGGEFTGGVDALASGASSLDSGLGALTAGTASAKDGAKRLSAGIDTLSSGSTKLDAGTKALAAGAHSLDSGLGTLADGTSQAADGSHTLSDGLDELQQSVDGMDEKVLDELQNTIDEKLGRGYQLHSFVEPSNTNVHEVQFVYVVSGVKSADDNSSSDDQSQQASDDEQQNPSFFDRLAALFNGGNRDE